jgi:hydroxyethylthiazole kinase-like uncharacterized protein yjeF
MPRLPCRIDPLIASWPLHGAVATRAIEQRAAAALPAHELMRRAGLGVARLALALAPHAPRFIVLAGPGNNGGDGIEAALQLQLLGKQTRVRLLADAARLPADAADALARAQAAGVPIEPGFDAGIGNDDDAPVIDALLGIGSKRAPQGALARAIEALRARRGIVLAVDVPSGLDALTGQPIGEHAVRATHTLSLLTLKPGLFTGTGRDHAGEAWFDDLGVAADLSCADALLAGGVSMTHDVERRHADHKGSRGDVHVVGGAPGMSGAALLAARAAHAAGAGRVYVVALDPGATLLDAARPELMFRARWWQAAPAEIAHGIVLAGCGGGDAVRAALPPLLSNATQLVLDADALNAIAGDESLQALLVARAARGGRPTIATPHPLEAARLLGVTAREVQADRLEAGRGSPSATAASRCSRARAASSLRRIARRTSIRPATPRSRRRAPATCSPDGSPAAGRRRTKAIRSRPHNASRRRRHFATGSRPTGTATGTHRCARPIWWSECSRSAERSCHSRGSGNPESAWVLVRACAGTTRGQRRRPGRVAPPFSARARAAAFLSALADALTARSARCSASSSTAASPSSSLARFAGAFGRAPSCTRRKSILRPSRSTRMTCTRTREPIA